MNRPADTQFPIHSLQRDRWSPLAFSDRPVAEHDLASLLEAARWAASCYNEQPWAFVVATRDQPADFERLAECLIDANRVWAGRAPVLILSAVRLHFERNGQMNAHAWYDVGQAVASLALQATALGLHIHQMAGFDPDKARAAARLPDTHAPATMMAVGYYGDRNDLPAELREREQAPRQRRAVREFACAGRWGQALTLPQS